MKKQTLWLLSGVFILGTASLARADESLSAEEFAARCEDANGNLTLDQNMRVDGGYAELGECQVTIGSLRLEIEHARLSSTGFLRAFGESGGEIRVEHSTLAQSEQALGPVSILLRAHRVRIEATTLDFSGTVHLETGADDRGRVDVLNSTLQSVAADIHVGSSGRGHEGRTRIEDSWLSAQVDISVLASSLVTGGRGEVTVEDCVFDSSGTITLETGEEGRTEVRGNDRSRQGEDMGSRIHAATTITQQRAAAKDYIDIAAVMRAGIDLSTALAAGRAVYGERFNPAITLRALASFDEGDLNQLEDATRKELASAASVVKLDQLPVLKGRPGLYGSGRE